MTRVFGWIAGAFWLMPFFGLTDLSVPVFFGNRPEFFEGYLIETGWGVLFTFFVGLPMCFVGLNPDWVSVALMSAASGIAVLTAAVASAHPVQLIIAAALLLQAAVVWTLIRIGRDSHRDAGGRRETSVERPVFGARIPFLGLALVSLPPAIMYASDMIQEAVRSGSGGVGRPSPGRRRSSRWCQAGGVGASRSRPSPRWVEMPSSAD